MKNLLELSNEEIYKQLIDIDCGLKESEFYKNVILNSCDKNGIIIADSICVGFINKYKLSVDAKNKRICFESPPYFTWFDYDNITFNKAVYLSVIKVNQ